MNLDLGTLNRRQLPTQLCILLTFACVPFWLRMDYAPPTYDRYYALGFLIAIPMGLTILSWLVTGLVGIERLAQQRGRAIWAIGLLLLALWMNLSVSWSFIANIRDLSNVTESVALQFSLVVLWAIATASNAPPIRAIIGVLIIGAVLSAIIGILQVTSQESIGLQSIGEFNLDPNLSGVSVLQANGMRWLRPYGLLPHPNILAGLLVVGTLTSVASVLYAPSHITKTSFISHHKFRILGGVISMILLWGLLLTFSRGAWLGFGAGAFALLGLLLRRYLRDKTTRFALAGLVITAIIVGGIFLVTYRPYVVARTEGSESIEMRSVADRIVFSDFAYRALSSTPQEAFLDDEATQSPLIYGIGAGNFPWRSSYYLVETDFDLRGNNVHHIWLSALVETGLVGYGFLILAIIGGVECALSQIRRDHALQRAVLFVGFIALGIIGLFDHYPWTMLQFQILWWGLLAVAMSHQETKVKNYQ